MDSFEHLMKAMNCSCVHTDTKFCVQFLDTPASLKPYLDVELRNTGTTCYGSQARSSF